jgi:hypothetical protein
MRQLSGLSNCWLCDLIFLEGADTEPTLPANGPILPVPVKSDDECGAVGGMIGTGKCSTREKPARVALCPPQIQAGTWVAAVGSQRPIAWPPSDIINDTLKRRRCTYSHLDPGLAVAQAVSGRFPTVAAWVRAPVNYRGTCRGQSGTGEGFLRVLLFPPSLIHATNCSTIITIYHLVLVQ